MDPLSCQGYAESHYGPDLQAAHNSDKNPLWLIDTLKAQGITLPKIYLTTGEDDFLAEVHQIIEKKLQSVQADYTAPLVPGIHDWDFLNRNLELALQWLTEK